MHTHIEKAFQLIKEGRKDEAEILFHKISEIKTDDIELIVQSGRLALKLDENIYALNSFTRATESQPENMYYTYLLASAHAQMGNLDCAEELCLKVIEVDPNHHHPYVILGKKAFITDHYSDAVGFFEKAIQLNPGEPGAYAEIINPLRSVGRHEEALKYAEDLLQMDSGARSHTLICRVLAELGRNDEAITHLEEAIHKDKTFGYAYHELSKIKKFSSEDSVFIQNTEKVLQHSVPATERSLIHFSLGKMYDDCKQWSKAFEHFKQGNILGKDAIEPTWLYNQYKLAKKIYNKSFLGQSELCGSNSDVPIFIIGMPRSGTTLIEQIIASHPQAAGAGELMGINNIHGIIRLAEKESVKELKSALSSEALSLYADEYLNVLCDSRENASRVVDKQPHNFIFLGLIHKLFPNARIIHALRNPLDTCLSYHFQAFSFIQQSYDLEWAGRAYRCYRKSMENWKKLLPEGVIFEVQYEQLVQDIEVQSHRIIDFCGLPWDDRCLEFYKTSRPIATASLWQARQPIYSSSAKRWINYAQHLGPLVNQISEYLDDEDIAELEKHGVKIKKKWSHGFLNRFKN